MTDRGLKFATVLSRGKGIGGEGVDEVEIRCAWSVCDFGGGTGLAAFEMDGRGTRVGV
jgi:hypothetical protein